MRKAVTVYATVASGAKYSTQNTQNPGAISSFDTDKPQRVVGVQMIGVGAQGLFEFTREGNTLYAVDGTGFSATYGPQMVDITYPPGIPITIDLINNTGGNLTNIPITVYYEVPGQ